MLSLFYVVSGVENWDFSIYFHDMVVISFIQNVLDLVTF